MYICDKNGQIYTGITTDLEHRMNQHKASLLYSEVYKNKNDAVKRERQIKGCIVGLKAAVSHYTVHDFFLDKKVKRLYYIRHGN